MNSFNKINKKPELMKEAWKNSSAWSGSMSWAAIMVNCRQFFFYSMKNNATSSKFCNSLKFGCYPRNIHTKKRAVTRGFFRLFKNAQSWCFYVEKSLPEFLKKQCATLLACGAAVCMFKNRITVISFIILVFYYLEKSTLPAIKRMEHKRMTEFTTCWPKPYQV